MLLVGWWCRWLLLDIVGVGVRVNLVVVAMFVVGGVVVVGVHCCCRHCCCV